MAEMVNGSRDTAVPNITHSEKKLFRVAKLDEELISVFTMKRSLQVPGGVWGG